jgi:hypothetical protein
MIWLENCPRDILHHIIQFLDVEEVCILLFISKQINIALENEATWKYLYRVHFTDNPLEEIVETTAPSSKSITWKDLFQERCTLQQLHN